MDDRIARRAPVMTPHPMTVMLLSVPVVCFAGALLTDISYLNSGGNLTWLNFSSWLIASGLLGGAVAALVLLVGMFRAGGCWLPIILLLAAWIIELLNSFVHARDGWTAVSGTGLMLSIVGFVFVLASAGALALRRGRISGEAS